MLQEQLFEEIKLIPSDKLDEAYALIHNFRVNSQKQTADGDRFSKRWLGQFVVASGEEPRLEYLKQRYQL